MRGFDAPAGMGGDKRRNGQVNAVEIFGICAAVNGVGNTPQRCQVQKALDCRQVAGYV